MSSIPPTEIQRRIGNLQSAMGSNGMDGALIVQKADLFYLSGTCQDAHLFVPTEGQPVLMVRKSYVRAAQDSPLEEVIQIGNMTEVQERVISALGSGPWALGLELDVLPVNNYKVYEKLFPQAEMKDVSPLIKRLRAVKSPYELALVRKAARMNDEMFSAVKFLLKEGLTEIAFSGLVEAEYRKMGHQGYVRVRGFNQDVFYGQIMSGMNLAVPSVSPGPTGGQGPNASFPHGAGHKKIARNEPVQIDYVAVFEGYMVDQARTFALGSLPSKFFRMHEKALAIQDMLVKVGVPGAKAEDLYDAALEMVIEADLEDGFMGWPQPVPFVGHGLGLELDELPVIGRKSQIVLREGMVIAIEPKFIIPGEGLAGIENVFVVTKRGLERLTRFDDAIQIIE